MFNSQMPRLEDLPTSRQLVRSTMLAAAAAGALLVTVIMPSEYAIDPTGVGRVLGLTAMGEVKMQLAREAAADATMPAQAATTTGPVPVAEATMQTPSPSRAGAMRSDEMELTLAPGEGAEIKVTAARGTRIAFDWSVAGGRVNYDTHGDRKAPPAVAYHGYGKGRDSTGEQGELVAAFDGGHGWFWRNRSAAPVTVKLRTNGNYTAILRVV